MISGFNTNVQYRGLVFHVQTEDSGLARPHIISHVYHQGIILASERSDYSGRIGSPDLLREVRARMEAQHKALIARLEQGELDAAIEAKIPGLPGASPPPTEPQVGRPAKPPPPPAPPGPARGFGDAVVSSRPLDEVILDYLVTKARRTRPKG
jgi:hypothetical protein